MTSNTKKGLILCQPDGLRGCSACCGLFNLPDISRSALAGFLTGGCQRAACGISGGEYAAHQGGAQCVRDGTAHVCPFQGFLDDGAKPGCLLHPLHAGDDYRDRSLYGAVICEDFFCPAHALLDDDRKRMLLECVKDWYAYSIAIIDPASFIWIYDKAKGRAPERMYTHATFSRAVTGALLCHAEFLNRAGAPVFHYSVSEYNLHKHAFSLAVDSDARAAEQSAVLAELERLL